MLANLALGFRDSVTQSQQVFHQAMMAMANPGQVFRLNALIEQAPKPLSPAAAALILALADFETPVWLDGPLCTNADVAHFLRFHTGAPLIERPDLAAFALISAPQDLKNGFGHFAQGSAEYPDRSTTLILQCDNITNSSGFELSGPGIAGVRHLGFAPQPPDFMSFRHANQMQFPCGIDIFGLTGIDIFGLPRSTKIKGAPCKGDPCM